MCMYVRLISLISLNLNTLLFLFLNQEANKPENRAVRPWIITMAHRPMYCSDDDHDDCTKFESYVRIPVLDDFMD